MKFLLGLPSFLSCQDPRHFQSFKLPDSEKGEASDV
jgi:hypothetical protein